MAVRRRVGGGRLRSVLASCLALAAAGAAPHASAADEYRLNAQDRVRVGVVEWVPASGDFRSPIAGEFTVGPSGSVSLPLLGDVAAAGSTVGDLAGTIAERLQAKLGLETRPNTSVEIVQFRPFYVAGAVERPGEYPYRPRLTVLQAVSLAGGVRRQADSGLLQLERDAAVAEEEIAALSAAIDDGRALRARLSAELADAREIAFPPELAGRGDVPAAARAMRLEAVQFETGRRLFEASLSAQRIQAQILDRELRSIESRRASLAKEQATIERQLAVLQDLDTRGLAASGRSFDVARGLSEIGGKQRELDVQAIRAHQDQARIEEALARAGDQRKREIGTQLQAVETRLAELTQRLDTDRRLVALAERRVGRAPGQAGEAAYAIIREENGAPRAVPDVTDMTALLPGDVLKVEPRGPGATLAAAEPNRPAVERRRP